MKELSPLQIERLKYQPKLPESLKAGINKLVCVEKEKTEAVKDKEQIKELFKNTYGQSRVEFVSGTETKTSNFLLYLHKLKEKNNGIVYPLYMP